MKDKPFNSVNRRAVLSAGSVILASTAALSSANAQNAAAADKTPPASGLGGGTTGAIFPVVDTMHGKVQGIENAGIKEFKYIPYGAPADGRNRYMPPKKPAPWKGVRNCIGYGPICPQTLRTCAPNTR